MDLGYFGELTLSLIVFAPGVLVLAAISFIWGLSTVEKMGAIGLLVPAHAGAGNPEPGPVVDGLQQAIEAEGTTEREVANDR